MSFGINLHIRYQFKALFGNGKKASRTDSFNQKIFKHVYEIDTKPKNVSIENVQKTFVLEFLFLHHFHFNSTLSLQNILSSSSFTED